MSMFKFSRECTKSVIDQHKKMMRGVREIEARKESDKAWENIPAFKSNVMTTNEYVKVYGLWDLK